MQNEIESISVVITTFDEGKRLLQTVKSIINQTLIPSEIIICEGGNTNNTKNLLKNLVSSKNLIKIINRKKKCRGGGRNEGIEFSKNNHIALIDAGAIAKKNWLKSLYNELNTNNSIDVVYGSVIPIRNNYFSRNVSNLITGKNIKNYKITNSVCSILFKKKLWLKINGFPESKDGYYAVEDLRFLDMIAKNNFKIRYCDKALVFWAMPANLNSLIKRFKEYSCGALENNYAFSWHIPLIKNYLLFSIIFLLSYFSNLFLILLLIIFLILRPSFYLKNFENYSVFNLGFYKDLIISGFLLIVIDLSTLLGFFKFLFRKLNRNNKAI